MGEPFLGKRAMEGKGAVRKMKRARQDAVLSNIRILLTWKLSFSSCGLAAGAGKISRSYAQDMEDKRGRKWERSSAVAAMGSPVMGSKKY